MRPIASSVAPLIVHAYGFCPGVDGCDHTPPDPAQVVICRAWLRRCARQRVSINKTVSSYRLKHAVEAACRVLGMSVYIANGAFIVAAQREGYRVFSRGGPNALFNISIRKHPLPTLSLSAVQA